MQRDPGGYWLRVRQGDLKMLDMQPAQRMRGFRRQHFVFNHRRMRSAQS